MGNVQQKGKTENLSAFQKRKLKYDFYTFFDLNNDGFLTYKDFLWAKDKICYMSGWKIDSPKYKITEALFSEIWKSLEEIADVDKDGKITKTEWLQMWETYRKELIAHEKEDKEVLKKFYAKAKSDHEGRNKEELPKKIPEDVFEPDTSRDQPHSIIELDSDEEPPSMMTNTIVETKASPAKYGYVNGQLPAAPMESDDEEKRQTVLEQFSGEHCGMVDETKLPKWLYKYLVFRFNLLDRTGDNVIDNEEFEYVLSEFGVSERIARQAFLIFTENNSRALDFEYFVQLFEQFYLSDDPSDLGNFINGKLEYDEDSEAEEEHGGLGRVQSDASLHSMDDDLKEENKITGSVIKLHDDEEKRSSSKRFFKNAREQCCAQS